MADTEDDAEDDAAADNRDGAGAGAAESTEDRLSAEDGVEHDADGGLAPRQLATFFALNEAVSLLQHAVEQQLRAEGDISFVQFQLLARLADAKGQLTMTELADGVVYSRSGLTYQAALLEKAGLITRGPSPDDERATLVTITDAGRARVARVLPGHVQVARRLLFEPMDESDVERLGDIMTRVRDHMRAQPPRSAAPRSRSRSAAGPAQS
ncbi:MarR family winged helix-turn-helix transcriptional regulator [Actinacidiphila acididurans]|uniref:MarR family transcriptional regulator n=1 Tax=Actinacidiphila acididurans TaxID=2784346 RepID=A0ABS2U069_9ACTN|nr:MarR family transcriptional regulator [Actinacidiphila acididurans]MBM9508995.1 MarR family transcriptional regulator [Actinacidiphila acididurans]